MKKLSVFQQIEHESTATQIVEALNRMEGDFNQCLKLNDYVKLKAILHDFCYEIIDVPETIQVFTARYAFTGVLISLLKTLSAKRKLTPQSLMLFYSMTRKVESWETLSEFFLKIPWFVKKVQTLTFTYPITHNKHVDAAIKLIHEKLTDRQLTVFWLAQQLNITTAHLNNLFKVEIGLSVSKYINEQRMQEIIYELTYSNKSLKEVRAQFGFKNASYFSQYFKKENHLTPLEYLKQHK